MSRRSRSSGPGVTTIYWRDIPAQVNGTDGQTKVQRVLPQRFHSAIDRAAMVAGLSDSDEYVKEWRKSVNPVAAGTDITKSTLAAEASIIGDFSRAVLSEHVTNGGWKPKTPTQDPS